MRFHYRFVLACVAVLWAAPWLFSQTCTCSGFNSARADSGWSFVDGAVFGRARSNLTDPAFFGAAGVVKRTIVIGAGMTTASEATLSGVNVFFTGWTTTSSYTANERTTILNAVTNGMNIVVTTDDTQHNLADLFGVTLSDTGAGINTPTVPEHPIFAGPFGKVVQFRSASGAGHYRAWPDGAEVLASSTAGPTMILIPRGTLAPAAGAVLLISDVDVLTNYLRDNPNNPDPSVPVTDALVMNIINFLCVTGATAVAPHLVLPQLANGDGNISSLVLTSTATQPIPSTNISFRDSDGAEWFVPMVGLGAASSFSLSNLEPNKTVTFTTAGGSPLRSGSVRIRSSPLLSGTVLFLAPGLGVTGVGASEVAGGFDLPIVPQPRAFGPGDVFTGFAATNLTNKTANVRLEIWDATLGLRADGILTITIPANGHIAKFLFELFPSFIFTGFRGTLRVVSTNALLSVTALQLGSRAGEFSALPVKALY